MFMLSGNTLISVIFILIGVIASLKVTRYFLSFLHINGDRVHFKYVELIEPVVFHKLVQSGEVKRVLEIAGIAIKLRNWVFIWTVNLYLFITFLILCGWK